MHMFQDTFVWLIFVYLCKYKNVPIYLCTSVCARVFVHVCGYNIRNLTHTYINIYVYIYIYIYIYMHMHECRCIYADKHAYIYIHINEYTYTYAYACM